MESAWLGLEDFVVEGDFVWVTGQDRPEYTQWAHGEPEADGEREDCGAIRDSGMWFDDRCYAHEHPAVCEMRYVAL